MNKLYTEIMKFNDSYNIIKIHKDNIWEYYIEKVGYGDLRHLVGIQYNVDRFDMNYVELAIDIAETDGFWKD